MEKIKEKKVRIITIRVSEDIYFRLEKYCNRFRLKKSRVITSLLNQFLK